MDKLESTTIFHLDPGIMVQGTIASERNPITIDDQDPFRLIFSRDLYLSRTAEGMQTIPVKCEATFSV